MVNYTLKLSKRKTVALHICESGVEVRAPLHISKREIESFVKSKEKWITEKSQIFNERRERRDGFFLKYNDKIIYRGKPFPVEAVPGNKIGFDDERFYIPPGLDPEQIKSACVQIYRMLAKRDLTAKTLYFAKQMNVVPGAVKINGAKARWGSCSAQKNLNFSWRLIIADDAAADYVVVHELAHIAEMNHSPRFWAIVEGVLPDYRERREQLRELQNKLSNENWD